MRISTTRRAWLSANIGRYSALLWLSSIAFASSIATAEHFPVYEVVLDESTELEDLFPSDFPSGEDALSDEAFPKEGLSNIVFGTPTMVFTEDGAGLRLDSTDAGRFYEQVKFDLGLNDAEQRQIGDPDVTSYAVEVGFVVNKLSMGGSNKNLSVFYDGRKSLTRVDFTPDGRVIAYAGDTNAIELGRYSRQELVTLRADFDLATPSLSLSLNNDEIYNEKDADIGGDLRAVRVSVALGNNWPKPSVTLHSIRVDADDSAD